MAGHLLTVQDLAVNTREGILDRAEALRAGAPTKLSRAPLIGLVFLASSLRTKTGFAAATARLGGTPIDASDVRWDANMSNAESFADTLRTVSGMVDAVIVRAPVELSNDLVEGSCTCPVVNGGDLRNHPTQALIDVFAMRQLAGKLDELSIAMCGDLTMRASRSLLEYLSDRPPRSLGVIAPPSRRGHEVSLPPSLVQRMVQLEPDEVSDIDVLILTGLAPKQGIHALSETERRPYVLTADRLARMKHDAIVISPLPVIDEIDDEARRDRRIRMFDESDLSVAVRMAVLEHVLTN